MLPKEEHRANTKLKSLIQAKLGDKKGAIETAKLSLASAKVAKNNDYVKIIPIEQLRFCIIFS